MSAWVNFTAIVTDPSVPLAHKVGPGLQDLQKRGQRILAERNAEKAEENTWIGQMVAAESIGELMDSSNHMPLRDKRADNGIGHDWLISATGLVFHIRLTMCHLRYGWRL